MSRSATQPDLSVPANDTNDLKVVEGEKENKCGERIYYLVFEKCARGGVCEAWRLNGWESN